MAAENLLQPARPRQECEVASMRPRRMAAENAREALLCLARKNGLQ